MATAPMTNMQVTGAALSGAVAAVLAKIIFYPLGTLRDTLSIAGSQGVKRLRLSDYYVGLPIGMLDSAQYHGMHFFLFEFIKVRVERMLNQRPLQPFPSLLTGMFGGTIVSLLGVPIETVLVHLRNKAGLGIKDNQTTWGAIQEIVRRDGIFGLWMGLRGNLMMVLQPAIIFVIVDRMKRRLTRNGKVSMTPFGSLLCGAVGEAISTVIVWPICAANKRIKTRHLRKKKVQENVGMKRAKKQKEEVLEVVPIIQKMYREEGFLRIYNGATPEICANALKGAFRYLVKDAMDSFFIGTLENMMG
jgi:hypothetical protein